MESTLTSVVPPIEPALNHDKYKNTPERRYTGVFNRAKIMYDMKQDVIMHDKWYYGGLLLSFIILLLSIACAYFYETTEPLYMRIIRIALAALSGIVSMVIQYKSYRIQNPKRYSNTVHFD